MPKQIPYPTDPVSIILSDGVERFLRYNLATLRRLKATQQNSLIGRNVGDIDEERLPDLIAAGLIDSDLTSDQVAELIDVRGLEYVAVKFMEAFGGQMESRPTIATAETPVADSTGADSGQSAEATSV